MKYEDFEDIISADRLQRYLLSCNQNTRKAMTLYRYNIRLSQELLAVVGCFEVALRNRINLHFITHEGKDWLRNLILPEGKFYSDTRVEKTKQIISKAYHGLFRINSYEHNKLLTEMEFGVWKYMFSNVQYKLTGQNLLAIFPNKPISNKSRRYDNSYIFKELDYINNLRNRIAHHEPVCFGTRCNRNVIDTSYALNRYNRVMTLFSWMGIDGKALLYGLGNVPDVCKMINNLQ